MKSLGYKRCVLNANHTAVNALKKQIQSFSFCVCTRLANDGKDLSSDRCIAEY